MACSYTHYDMFRLHYYSMSSSKNKNQKSLNKNNLYDQLSKLEDFRRAQGRVHELRRVLIIVIMAVMSGYKGLRPMKDFVEKNRRELLELFQPKNDKLPSRKTIGRVLQNVDFEEFTKIFHAWAIRYVKINNKDWLSVDGKVIGGTVDDIIKQNFINLVSVFASKRKQVIMAGKIKSGKESEIPKVRELIKMLGLEDIIFTIDALHCQTETTKTIIESKNDYVLGVKGNQPKLYRQLKKTPREASR